VNAYNLVLGVSWGGFSLMLVAFKKQYIFLYSIMVVRVLVVGPWYSMVPSSLKTFRVVVFGSMFLLGLHKSFFLFH
jgi:hypothetical protein